LNGRSFEKKIEAATLLPVDIQSAISTKALRQGEAEALNMKQMRQLALA
jgi:hypothetical protein